MIGKSGLGSEFLCPFVFKTPNLQNTGKVWCLHESDIVSAIRIEVCGAYRCEPAIGLADVRGRGEFLKLTVV